MNLESLQDIQGRKLLLEVSDTGISSVEWAKTHKQAVNELIEQNGAVVIRGLNFVSNRLFSRFLSELFGGALGEYVYRSTPRLKLKGNVYTASEYPNDEHIPLHNENAYANRYPSRIGFLCMVAAEQGGETPICDSREIYQNIDAEVREEFERKKVKYVRNYGNLDLSWQEVFQTDDPIVVEQYCKDNQLQFHWGQGEKLRTEQVNEAVLSHPLTGEKVWFNQAHLFHVSSLNSEVRERLLQSVDEADLPRNAWFGDGSAIPENYLQHIRDVYAKAQITFPWQKHDVMLLDNLLFAHGRKPYQGERQVLVGMS